MAVLTDDIKKDIALIYVGVFGRAPEGEGLNYWVEQFQANNWSLRELAENMYIAALEYPGYENLSDPKNLVEAVYQNVLGKTSFADYDGDGVIDNDWWVDQINKGLVTPGKLIADILYAAITQYSDDPATKTLLNRAEVAVYAAEKMPKADINGDNVPDFDVFKEFIANVTDDPNTVQQAMQQVDEYINKGQEFTLTTQVDEIVGTPKNDVINAVVSSQSSENTLNPDDKIDGGDGTDTINITVKGNFNGFSNTGYLKNVEVINLTNESVIPRTFSAKGIEGAQKYVIDASKAAINLSDLGDLNAEIYLKNQKSGTFGILRKWCNRWNFR
ncbi:MAG: hypothetical protein DSY32_00380 [Aquifex sp.]|nr:MAG: hypothetical protein DSY32_00380 [Aquifex sp.]